MDNLNCPKCKHPMTPCYNGEGFLRIWWCQVCDHTDKAIGRERLGYGPRGGNLGGVL